MLLGMRGYEARILVPSIGVCVMMYYMDFISIISTFVGDTNSYSGTLNSDCVSNKHALCFLILLSIYFKVLYTHR